MAKSVKIRRKELNQPDQFISTTDVVMAYCSKHKTGLISIVTVLILVILSGLWIRHSHEVRSLRMESLYFEMEQARTAEGANSSDIVNKMEILLNEFSKSPQKQRANLLLADEVYNTRNYDRAIELYKGVLNESSSTSLSYQLASIGIAYSLEGKKDYKNAIIAYKNIIQLPNNEYPLFNTYIGLARCYELNQDNNGALLILREMKTKFLSHSKFEMIEAKLKRLDVSA